ncbi:hypothetical protein [uncultured Erythrobacter sp.]|uniref:hypothetical protein n=1 Tax=uncultured Erythrobacter sp. TaxID=263913 RepID=UPI002630DE69|nr:hypothetical protein [uncultured Erythrobacter sp.]
MTKLSLGGSACVAALLLSGCSTTHHFQIELPVREGSAQPAKVESFGGAIANVEILECESNGVADVFVKRGFFESLLSTITLGGYQSTKIEYVCAKEADGEVPTLGGSPEGEGASDGD